MDRSVEPILHLCFAFLIACLVFIKFFIFCTFSPYLLVEKLGIFFANFFNWGIRKTKVDEEDMLMKYWLHPLMR